MFFVDRPETSDCHCSQSGCSCGLYEADYIASCDGGKVVMEHMSGLAGSDHMVLKGSEGETYDLRK